MSSLRLDSPAMTHQNWFDLSFQGMCLVIRSHTLSIALFVLSMWHCREEWSSLLTDTGRKARLIVKNHLHLCFLTPAPISHLEIIRDWKGNVTVSPDHREVARYQLSPRVAQCYRFSIFAVHIRYYQQPGAMSSSFYRPLAHQVSYHLCLEARCEMMLLPNARPEFRHRRSR